MVCLLFVHGPAIINLSLLLTANTVLWAGKLVFNNNISTGCLLNAETAFIVYFNHFSFSVSRSNPYSSLPSQVFYLATSHLALHSKRPSFFLFLCEKLLGEFQMREMWRFFRIPRISTNTNFIYLFRLHCEAHGILIPVPPAVEAQSLKHGITREVPLK